MQQTSSLALGCQNYLGFNNLDRKISSFYLLLNYLLIFSLIKYSIPIKKNSIYIYFFKINKRRSYMIVNLYGHSPPLSSHYLIS